jgi:hypothetical protein
MQNRSTGFGMKQYTLYLIPDGTPVTGGYHVTRIKMWPGLSFYPTFPNFLVRSQLQLITLNPMCGSSCPLSPRMHALLDMSRLTEIYEVLFSASRQTYRFR